MHATIVDVRMPGEFLIGHVSNSINIPLYQLSFRIEEFRHFTQPVIICSESDEVSKQAVEFLKAYGVACESGGSWIKMHTENKSDKILINHLGNIFDIEPNVDYATLLDHGGIIVDVRPSDEFQEGNITGSFNMPLYELDPDILGIHRDRPVITCCTSGIYSAIAKRILREAGFTDVHNGGNWIHLQSRL